MTRDPIAREKIKGLSLRLTESISAQDRANRIALDAAEKAVLKAETASEKRFEAVNEFRQTLSDQAANFITRKEVEALLGAVNATLGRLETSGATTAGRGQGANYLWQTAVAVIGLLVLLGGFYIALRGHV